MTCSRCPFHITCWSGVLDRISFCHKCKRIRFHLHPRAEHPHHKYVITFTCSERWTVLMLSDAFYSKRGVSDRHTRYHKDPMVLENEVTVQDCWLCKHYTKEAIRTMFEETWLDLDNPDEMLRLPS